jgi:RNA-dependent RNA polymerase
VQLKGLKIFYRPSMVKVTSDPVLKDFPTVNSFEIVNTNIWYVGLNFALLSILCLD